MGRGDATCTPYQPLTNQPMNKIFTTLSILSITLFFAACGGAGGYQGESNIQAEVEKIHLEAMPLVQTIYLLRKDLIEVKSNGTFDKKMLTANEKAEVDSACVALTHAEEDMNTWMRGYKEPEFGTSMATADTYFQSELVKVKALAQTMNASIEKGKALSERFPIRAAEVKTEVKKATTKRDTTRKTNISASSETPAAATPAATQKTEPSEKPDAPEVPKAETPKVEAPLVPKTATSPRVAPAGSKIAR
jgi:hypothetical protein